MTPQRALVIHSDSVIRRALAEALAAAGYEVRECAPHETLASLRQSRFDLLAGDVDATLEQLRIETIQPLLRITEALVSETSLATIGSATLAEAMSSSGAAAAWMVVEEDAAMLEMVGNASLEPRELGEMASWLLHHQSFGVEPRLFGAKDFSGGVAPSGGVFTNWLASEGWDQIIAMPLAVKGQRIGAIFAAGRAESLHSAPVDLRYLSLLAGQAAIAIENTRLYHRARTQSLTDSLTGLPNARFLRDHLDVMLAQARRGRRPFSLILLDSDSLKRVNDQFGHQAGDRLIQELAQTIKRRGQGVRSSDIVVRYAGDEFVVLMPDTDAAQAAVVGERLRIAVDHEPFRVGDLAYHCTISLGVATYPDDADSADALLRCADDAMYEAKHRGKNQVVTYHNLVSQRPTAAALTPNVSASRVASSIAKVS